MKKSMCEDSSHNFARLMSYFYSDDYVLPSNKVTRGEIQKTLKGHFEEQLLKRYEVARTVIETYGTGIDRMVDEKINALTNIMLFLFSSKKPSGLCVITRSDNPKAKSDKFYTEINKVYDSLLSIEIDLEYDLLKFYPTFHKQHAALLESFKLVLTNMKVVGEHNDRISELVLDAIHTLKMNPEAYTKEEIRTLIKESVGLIQKTFPEIKQHQNTTDLQQYFSKELNYLVTLHGEEGPRRISIADQSKKERRDAEEEELKKRGF